MCPRDAGGGNGGARLMFSASKYSAGAYLRSFRCSPPVPPTSPCVTLVRFSELTHRAVNSYIGTRPSSSAPASTHASWASTTTTAPPAKTTTTMTTTTITSTPQPKSLPAATSRAAARVPEEGVAAPAPAPARKKPRDLSAAALRGREGTRRPSARVSVSGAGRPPRGGGRGEGGGGEG